MSTEEQTIISNHYRPEIIWHCNRLLYFEFLEKFESCTKLRDAYTIEAYEWAETMYEDKLKIKSCYDLLEKVFDEELVNTRDKYFLEFDPNRIGTKKY
jgi:hypothetical protein